MCATYCAAICAHALVFVGAAYTLPVHVPEVGCSQGGDWFNCSIACWPAAWMDEISGSIIVQFGVDVANTRVICAASRASVTPAWVSRFLSDTVRNDSARP